jgi:flavin-dependent dehydrogenase
MVADMEKSIVIAGGGLAGLACGIRLQERGWDVTVHERRRYPLKKVCGEFLSPQGWRRVQSLGAAKLLPRPPRELKRARFYSGDSAHFDMALKPAAWGLSRETLDTALAQRFRQAGGELREGSELTDLEPGVLDARGRPADEAAASWIGWKAYLAPDAAPPVLDEVDLLMLPVPGGYCGLARIEDGRVSVGLVAHGNASLPELCASHPILAAQSAALQAHAAVARFDFRSYSGDSRLGDARRVWPPLLGDGMSQALAAGEATAVAMDEGRKLWQPGAAVQFYLARGLHSLMLVPVARRAAGTVCKALPSLPEAIYRISRG